MFFFAKLLPLLIAFSDVYRSNRVAETLRSMDTAIVDEGKKLGAECEILGITRILACDSTESQASLFPDGDPPRPTLCCVGAINVTACGCVGGCRRLRKRAAERLSGSKVKASTGARYSVAGGWVGGKKNTPAALSACGRVLFFFPS